MKNIIKRDDGRWMYRKQIHNKRTTLYANTQKELLKKIQQLNKNLQITYKTKAKSFYDLAQEWYTLFKKGKISSEKIYESIIKNEFNKSIFLLDINQITLIELQNYINNLSQHRKAKYCYNTIKNVFKYALQKDVIKKDISQFLQAPVNKTEKGSAFTLSEQKSILANLDKTTIKYEILFYLLTGCRRSEATNVKKEHINFERNTIFIDGTKTKSAKRYIKISEKFKIILQNNFNNMFKFRFDYYSRKFTEYLNKLNIQNKTLHDLRHTFSTNLYYLGVPDKERQYYMGHSSIVMTNDIYTTLDPTITKEDILNLYKDLYPKFWHHFWHHFLSKKSAKLIFSICKIKHKKNGSKSDKIELKATLVRTKGLEPPRSPTRS